MGALSRDILTDRQWEVAYLLSNGLTDPEIAGVLTIAAGTASIHVHEILSRLGVRRRVEAAAWYWELPEPAQTPENI
jgi:DNA-binding NarL/FixJ family response regulator